MNTLLPATPSGPTPAISRTGVDWRQLYDALGERVFRMLHRMTGDAAQAEDLTQDTFVRVHEARDQYDQSGPVAAWVFRIAANLARDEFRRGTMRRDRLALLHRGSRTPTPADPILRLSLEAALQELGEDQRTVVLLHDVDGYSHAEIAGMLGIAEGTSRARLSRARELLRRVLAADVPEDRHG